MVIHNPEVPPVQDLQDYDIFARFTTMVGHPFSEQIPAKSDKPVATWEIVGGSLPRGLSFDQSTGVISGNALVAQSRSLRLLGTSADGLETSLTAVQIDVSEFNERLNIVSIPAHEEKQFSFNITKGSTVIERWEAVKLPSWATTGSVFLNGTPPDGAEGVHDIELLGYDYRGEIATITKGTINVTDGPVVRHIPDVTQHPSEQFEIELRAANAMGKILWSVEGALPNNLQIASDDQQIIGKIPTFETSATLRVAATDIDGTVGYSNWFTLTTPPAISELNPAMDRYLLVGAHTAFSFTTSDVPSPRTWEIVEGTLPAGLTLNPTTGMIQGRPTVKGTYSDLVIRATSNLPTGETASSTPFSIFVSGKELTASVEPIDARIDTPFVTNVPDVANAEGALTFEVAPDATIPSTLALDPVTGQLYGTVSDIGNNSVLLVATDGSGNRSKPFTVGIHAYGPLTISTDKSIYLGTRGSAIENIVPNVNSNGYVPGNKEPYTLTGTLPNGLTFNRTNGQISGTPTVEATFTGFIISVTDGLGDTASTAPFSIEIGPRLMPEVLVEDHNLIIGKSVSVPVAKANNIIGAASWSLTGALPAGITFSNTGVLSGVPSALGEYGPFTVTAIDIEGERATSDNFTIRVVPPADLEVGNADYSWSAGKPFAFPLAAKNAAGAVTWQALGLPEGVALNSHGTLSGTVAAPTSFNFVAQATDTLSRTASGTIKVDIKPVMTMNIDPTVNLVQGDMGKVSPIVSNGIEPIEFTQTGSLPVGMSFFPTGDIEGIPTTVGTSSNIQITAVDATGTSITVSTSISVNAATEINFGYDFSNPLAVNTSNGLPRLPVSSGISKPANFTVHGDIPPGISFDTETGSFSGVPSQIGSWNDVYVSVVDDLGRSANTEPFTITVAPSGAITAPNSHKSVRTGEYFTVDAPQVKNAIAPLSFAVEASTEPSISVDPLTGAVTGMIHSAGLHKIDIRVTDALSRTATFRTNIEVVGPIELHYSDEVTNRYQLLTFSPETMNAVGAVNYSLVAGSLPTGMSLNTSTGAITGTPIEEGIFAGLRIRAVDSGTSGNTAESQPFTITVDPRLPLEAIIDEENIVIANVSYRMKPKIMNAVGAVSYSLSGTLPAGLSFNTGTGYITGTVTDILRAENLIITVTDSVGGTASTLPFAIQSATDGLPIRLTTYTVKTKPGYTFTSREPAVSNAVGTIRFQSPDASGRGLSLDTTTGVVTGVLNEIGDYTIYINVVDSSNRLTQQPLKIQVLPPIRIEMPWSQDSTVLEEFEWVNPVIMNAVGGVTYQLIGDTIPVGLSFSTRSGRFYGTPTEIKTIEGLVIRVTDITGDFAYSNEFRLAIHPSGVAPKLTVPSLGKWKEGTYVSYKLVAVPSKTGDVFSYTGELPTGVTLNPSTGILSGTPTVGSRGLYENVVFSVTDTAGLRGHKASATITVAAQAVATWGQTNYSYRVGEPFETDPIAYNPAAIVGKIRFEKTSYTRFPIDADTGRISGVMESGTRTFDISVHDDTGRIATASEGPRVRVAPVTFTISGLSNQSVNAGEYFITPEPTVQNARKNLRFSLIGSLPAGASFDENSGQIYGTFPSGINRSYQVVASDDFGSVTSSAFTIVSNVVPEAFVFNDVLDAEINQTLHSNIIQLRGFEGSASVQVTGPSGLRWYTCSSSSCGDATTRTTQLATSIAANTYIKLSLPTGSSRGTTQVITVKVGDYTTQWTVTNRDSLTAVDPILLADTTDVDLGGWAISEVFQIKGNVDPVQVQITHSDVAQRNLCASLNPTSCTNTWGSATATVTYSSGQYMRFRARVPDTHNLSRTVSFTVGDYSGTWLIKSRGVDTDPDPFTIEDLNDVEFGELYLSTPVRLTGFWDEATVTINNVNASRWRRCETASLSGCSTWQSYSGTLKIQPEKFFQLQVRSSENSLGVVAVNYKVGNQSGTWRVTSRRLGNTPDEFTIPSTLDQEPKVGTTKVYAISDIIPLTGHTDDIPFTMETGFTIARCKTQSECNSPSWNSLATSIAANIKFIRLRYELPNTFGTQKVGTFNFGSFRTTWTVRTRDKDTTPNPFTFPATTGAALNKPVTSARVQINGMDDTTISVTGGAQFRTCSSSSSGCTGWVTSKTVTNGQWIEIQFTTPNASQRTTVINVNATGYSTQWSITTQ